MFTLINLSILCALVGAIGLIALVVGFIKDVRSIKLIGVYVLGFLAAMLGCYIMGWTIPMIIVMGLIASAFLFIGTSGEDSEDSFYFGIFYMCIGLYLFYNTFLLWYQNGWYTSMAFTAWLLCITSLINAFNCNKDYIPILSLITSVIFALLTIYLWMMLSLKGMQIFWSGTFAAIFLRSLWWLVYGRKMERDSRLGSD